MSLVVVMGLSHSDIVIESSHCNSFEDQAPAAVGKIFECPVFKWVAAGISSLHGCSALTAWQDTRIRTVAQAMAPEWRTLLWQA